MAIMDDVKQKFNQLQEEVNTLNNKKIGLESEVKTMNGDLKELTTQLLELTGKSSFKEAVEYFESRKQELTDKATKLKDELDSYLADSGNDKVINGDADFFENN